MNGKAFHTHVLLDAPYGMFTVADSRYDEFWDVYVAALYAKDSAMFIAERPSNESPVLADIDLRITKKTADEMDVNRIYTANDVKTIVAAYQNTLREVLHDITDEALTCLLLEKDPYTKRIGGGEYMSNGFHLQFPYCFVDRRIQSIYIVPIVKEKLVGLFADRYNGEIVNFIDANCDTVHWLLYGSTKGVGHRPYTLTKCFDSSCDDTSILSALKRYRIPGCNSNITSSNIKDLLPRILSIKPYGREHYYYYRSRESVNTPLLKKYADKACKRRRVESALVADVLDEARSLIALMADVRAEDRTFWRNVGYCLWNITDGDDEGLVTWLEFSEKSEKFVEVDCISMWQSMRRSEFTIGTLKFYAKSDSPDEYKKLYSKKISALTCKDEITHNDIAKVMYYEFGDDFICASIDTRLWYRFKDHIWRTCDKGHGLRETISTIIHDRYIQRIEHCLDEATDEAAKKSLFKHKMQTSRDLKSAPYKNNVMTECCEVFYNPLFKDHLNKNPHLIAFKNGVYDFSSDEFRDGIPEDYLSVSLPIDYEDYGSPCNMKIIEIQQFFQEIFPDDDIRNYFLDQACQSFVGGNADKVFLIWTGTGNNGKTITQTLFEKMFGGLAVKFSTTLLTGKKQQIGVASPELARGGNGVRWAVMDEPNPDETINAGILKALTGNDSYWARDLFEKGKETREIVPLFKLHMICNRLPRMSRDADAAAWGRIRVIPFESQFLVSGYPDRHEDRVAQRKFPIDIQMNDKLDSMLKPLAWYLIRRWRDGEWKNRAAPEKVRVATASYHHENDMYSQFIEECIYDDDDDVSSTLTFDALYNVFKQWFRDECPSQVVPQRMMAKQKFVDRWGNLVNGRHWVGLRLVSSTTGKRSNPMLTV